MSESAKLIANFDRGSVRVILGEINSENINIKK